jgi:rfaE bifunctional protein kinase chain/domain
MLQVDVFSGFHVLVVGDVMLDRYWFGSVDRISPEAPVPVVRVNQLEERAGGAANVANNASALGADCTLLSVVGDDDAGAALQRLLADSTIDVKLAVDRDASTTVKLRILSQNQQLLRADFETPPSHEILAGCLEDFSNFLPSVDAVIVSDYGKGGLYHLSEMIRIARQQEKPVIVDPKGSDFSRYAGVTALTPNLQEFEKVAGVVTNDTDLEKKAAVILDDLNVEKLLVTRSDKGMSLIRRDGAVTHSPARARAVYDVSGAGDTVISAFTMAILAGFTDQQVLRFANAAAGIVVAKLGTAAASQAEIISALDGEWEK